MPRFYLHLRNGEEAVRDDEGLEFSDLSAAIAAAARDVRDVIAADVLAGQPVLLDSYVSVEDETGQEVHRSMFRDAVQFR